MVLSCIESWCNEYIPMDVTRFLGSVRFPNKCDCPGPQQQRDWASISSWIPNPNLEPERLLTPPLNQHWYTNLKHNWLIVNESNAQPSFYVSQLYVFLPKSKSRNIDVLFFTRNLPHSTRTYIVIICTVCQRIIWNQVSLNMRQYMDDWEEEENKVLLDSFV